MQLRQRNVLEYRNKGGVGNVSGLGLLEIDADSNLEIDNTLILESNYTLSDKIDFESQIGVNF